MIKDLKQQYRASLKSSDTEENIDLAFYRPLGFAWAYLFRRIGVTPNAVTIASIFLGVGAGICFYFDDMWINVLGMLLLVWANTFDSCDGQLARLTHNYSPIGRILDGLGGDLWFVSIYIAICLRMNVTSPFFGEHPWLIWIIAVVAGISHAKQTAMADCYRQFHLYHVNGSSGSELDSSADIRSRRAALPSSGNFWQRLILWFYAGYTMQQEATTPAMQSLRRLCAVRFPDGLPDALRQDFRRESLPLMKYTNILTFNWRSITLFITLFISQPWIYFAGEIIIFNIILIYMVHRHEAICRRFIASIEHGRYD